jgi:hypothetical protein
MRPINVLLRQGCAGFSSFVSQAKQKAAAKRSPKQPDPALAGWRPKNLPDEIKT